MGVVEKLLALNDIDVNDKNNYGETALMLAVKSTFCILLNPLFTMGM